MFLLFMSLGISGRLDQHILMACVGAMLGMANAASSMILKWKMQFACALVWWALTVFACFGKGQCTDDCISGGAFLLPDRVWDLRHDLRRAEAADAGRDQGAANA